MDKSETLVGGLVQTLVGLGECFCGGVRVSCGVADGGRLGKGGRLGEEVGRWCSRGGGVGWVG